MVSVNQEIVPKLSIGIPAYNGERFIRTAIESCLQQTHEPFEILLSNNVSIDRTQQILEEYADRPGIKIVSPAQHLGIGAHYRHLADAVSGTHAIFLSCDDALHPEFVRFAIRELSQNPDLGMLAFGGYSCNSDLLPVSRFGLSYPTQTLPRSTTYSHFSQACTFIMSSCVWKHDLVQSIEPLPKSAGLVTDWYWALVTGLQSPIRFSRKALAYYRFHDSNSSHSNYGRWLYEAAEMLDFLLANAKIESELRDQLEATRLLIENAAINGISQIGSEIPSEISNSQVDLISRSIKQAIKQQIKKLLAQKSFGHPSFLR